MSAAASTNSTQSERKHRPSRYALPPCPHAAKRTLEDRFSDCLSIAAPDGCIQPDELKTLLATCPNPVAYDGFEPSGRMHIAQGLFKALLVNKLTSSGFTYIFWIADRFACLNMKLGGDFDKIQTVGRYFIEVWKAVGMNMDRVKFLWASEEIRAHNDEYWELVFDIATKFNLKRMVRCSQIMGRQESDTLQASQILYPLMQCADVFFLGVNVCQLGDDQRKVNMLAREYVDECTKAGKTAAEKVKPIILGHSMLPGLTKGTTKMSKSDPSSSIFMEDSEEEVQLKIQGAFCPPGEVKDNPCLVYLKAIVFPSMGIFRISRSPEHGGDIVFDSYEELEKAYVAKAVYPADVKDALALCINTLLAPVRKHFASNSYARDLLAQVRSFRTTTPASSTTRKE